MRTRIPISKLLIHNATLVKIEEGVLEEGKRIEIPLEKIRVDVTTINTSLSNMGASIQKIATLFYFPNISLANGCNSTPSFNDGDKIRFDGTEWLIAGSRAIYDSKGISHYEVALE